MPDEYDVKDEHREPQDEGGEEEEEVRNDSFVVYAARDHTHIQLDLG